MKGYDRNLQNGREDTRGRRVMLTPTKVSLAGAAALGLAFMIGAPLSASPGPVVGADVSGPAANTRLQPTADTDQIYAEQCAPCHGDTGEGASAPSLEDSSLSPSDRFEIISEGRGAMPAFAPTLTTEEVQAVSDLVGRLVGVGIYRDQCAPCHGENLEGGVGPPLLGVAIDPEQQMSIVTEGRGAMPAFGPTLSEEQLRVLESFLTSAMEDAPPPTETAEQLYESNCAFCHGTELEGGIGPSLAGSTLNETELAGIIDDGTGTMQGFADSLSPEEVSALVDFVFRAQVETTDSVPEVVADVVTEEVAAELYAESCRTCHGPGGEGGAGPALLNLSSTDAELASVIADGRGSMPGFGTAFSESEITAVALYTAALSLDTQTVAPPQAIPADGLSLFLGHCSECHGESGEGKTAPNLAGADLGANEIVVHVWSGHPDMPAFHETLTPDEILAVSSYAADLAPTGLAGEDAETTTDWAKIIALVLAVLVVVGVALLAYRRFTRPR